MDVLLIPHIVAGAVALASGVIAIIARKGSKPHRLAGNAFVLSMLLMAVSGGYIAFLASDRITVLVSLLTVYLVGTAWTAVRRSHSTRGLWQWSAFLAAIFIAGFGGHLGLEANQGRADVIDGTFVVPAAVYWMFGGIAALAAVGDAWTIVRGPLVGRARLARHLWRMCVALYIAASSFFTGQQDVFPEALRGSLLLQVPELLVLSLLLFWLVMVGRAKRFAGPRKQST